MVDVSGTAGTVVGIMGMGIGLGLLAHTARNVSRMSDGMYGPRRQSYNRGYGSRPYSRPQRTRRVNTTRRTRRPRRPRARAGRSSSRYSGFGGGIRSPSYW